MKTADFRAFHAGTAHGGVKLWRLWGYGHGTDPRSLFLGFRHRPAPVSFFVLVCGTSPLPHPATHRQDILEWVAGCG
jgi:hypothetical protein